MTNEPDARFTLANERTFLAWVRTSLALLAGGVAVHAPAVDLEAWVRTAISLVLLGCAALTLTLAWQRWRIVDASLRTGTPMPGFGGPALLAGILALLVVGLAIGVIFDALR